MAQKYCENCSAAGVPNFVIFVRPVACGPWPRARVTQKACRCCAEDIVAALEGRVSPRLLPHLDLLKLLRAWALSQASLRAVRWSLDSGSADILSGSKNLLDV